jgi:hypothetical protein
MVLYGVALLPLIDSLRRAVLTVLQPWYADDAAMVGPVEGLAEATRLLAREGPSRGYYPEPAKSIFVGCKADEAETCRQALAEFNFQFREGSRCAGGFIASEAAQAEWIEPQIQKWVGGIVLLARVARRFPQMAYAGLVKSLQTEWTYLQRIVPGSDALFGPIEEAIAGIFLPALLGESEAGVQTLRRQLALSVRTAGLGIPDPRECARGNFDGSRQITRTLTASLLAREALHTEGYRLEAGKCRRLLRLTRVGEGEVLLSEIKSAASQMAVCRIERAKLTGAWLTVMPDKLNGTVLSAEEFRDSLRLRFGLTPSSLPSQCDGCGQRFTVEHAMTCRKGGMIVSRHNNVCAEWSQLCAQALSPSAVSDEPLINSGRDYQAEADATGTEVGQNSVVT